MPATLTPDQIGAMTPATLLERIHAMPLVELATMTREAVEAMPEEARAARRERLYNDPTIWDGSDFAAAAGVGESAIKKWRNNYLNGKPGGLLRPCNEDTDDIKKPGETRQRSNDRPKYRAGEARRWLKDEQIVNVDLFPIRRTSPGRPKKQAG